MKRAAQWLPATRWLLVYAAATWLFFETSESLRVAHGVVVYLLLIIGASATVGLWLGLGMVLGGYLAVDWLFVPPLGAFGAPRTLDGAILAGFVAAGVSVSALLASFRQASARAEQRAAEIERLAVERRRMAEEIARTTVRREAEQLRTALLRSIAHDLRTPLSAIRLAADGAGGSTASTIGEHVKLLTGYVDAVQEFGRVGVEPSLRKDANVAEDLIGAAVRSAQAALGARSVRVTTPPDGEVLVGDFDFALALRALVNLIENAARYAPADLPVDVELSRNGKFVQVTVLDRGPGLAANEAATVFDPFRRGSAAAHTRGSGLGLAIARTFARAQGGDVTYAPRDGGGAAFALQLPLRLDD